MKAGVVYPQTELGGDTGAVKAFAQAAEDLGYDHIVIYDHVLGAVHAGREPKLTGPQKKTIRSTSRWSPTLTSPASPRTSD
jgi:alkanesulfonate monooxygenase SsuD/methylene tetrahydromethanopterin reductase-like flavin-dependent oxidoreductase (luciferase family)